MAAETVKWYRSRVDWWMVPVLCVGPLAAVAACVALLLTGQISLLPWGLAGVLLMLGVYFGLIFPLRYGLDDTCLLVRFGICRHRIALADITEVSRTRNPIGSPALSLDRLRIQSGKGIFNATLISPVDQNRFMDDLARQAGLEREGNRLIRK
jgi:hypothetical protein